MSTQGKQRIRYIDFFKATAMVLVVLGHINFANQGIKAWIYAFHMPVFFFISGMMLTSGRVNTLSELITSIQKRFLSLMIPYFLWALIYAKLDIGNVARIVYGSYHTISASGSLTSLWFLPALFIGNVMYITAQFLLKEKFTILTKTLLLILSFGIAFIIPKTVTGYPWCIDVSFAALGFLLIGHIIFPYINSLYSHLKSMDILKSLILYTLGMVGSFVGTLLYKYNLPYVEERVLVAKAQYGNPCLFLITSLSGCIFIVSLGLLIDKLIVVGSRVEMLLSLIGMNTLIIFTVQKPIISVFRVIFGKISLPNALELIMTCIFTLLGSLVCAIFINSFIPNLAGKNPDRKKKI